MALSNADRQRLWRQRHKGENRTPAAPGFDPAEIEVMREALREKSLKLELREQDVARLTERNTYLESELKRVERHNTNVLKEVISLRRELAQRR